MVWRRIGVFVSVLVVPIVAATFPALAIPPCSSIGFSSCNYDCSLSKGDNQPPPPTCQEVTFGACVDGVELYRYTCTENVTITKQCTCDDPPEDPPSGGCFLAGTPISMADGSTRPIEEIQAGDTVFAYDEASKQMKPDKVKVVHPVVERDFYLVVNGKMKLTPNHRVLSKGEWVEIGQLAVGDTLTAPDGEPVPIEKIEKVEGKVKVYNFAVNPYETYVASGVIVHNRKQETTPPPEP